MWRRLKYIPFTFQFAPEDINEHFREEVLKAEYEGILVWLVSGCMEWCQQKKLVTPKVVTEATQEYRREMDTFGRFLEDVCVIGETDDFGCEIKAETKRLLEAYQEWCEANSEHFDATHLKRELNNRGFHSVRKGFGDHYGYHGIGLKPSTGNAPTADEMREKANHNIMEELERQCSKIEGIEGKRSNHVYNSRIEGALVNSGSTPSIPSMISQNGNHPETAVNEPEMSEYEKAERENLLRLLNGEE